MRLFLARGYDRVSMHDIARAAEVSLKTIYNYFPGKADLVFDESDEIIEKLITAIRQRPEGESALAALDRFLAESRRRAAGRRPPAPSTAFRQLIESSPALRSYRREMFARMEAALAAVLAEETRAPANAVEPFVAAAAFVAVFRARFELPTDAGQPGAVQAEIQRRTRTALLLLRDGLGGYAAKRATSRR
jgi:AcrR family transcriptional regulator